ncbi:MAG TPA: hypothetical protein PKD99_10835 [Sphingopyxis sp.]|nr:hypothetical protein [Sphingopyxis sp.]HMP45591.1 hypothetical protein [Sphingopyxis sp.]HMQ17701.1 hypothetical protein [Sphingopyxis sp.]
MHERPSVPLIELLPQHLRNRDVREGRALEALMELLAGELAVVERDIDQLYDNWFIESCEPWVIPYIGALIGARPIRSFGAGEVGLRSYVANTLGYRQAKGTAAALEQVARDVTGWPVVAVEFFERLIWSQHVNHIRPGAIGTASVRDAEAARLSEGPFGTACHSAAAAPADSASGRYAIPHVGLFIWRLDDFPLGFLSDEADGYLGGPVPRASTIGPAFRHFDPVGADRPLFNRRKPDRSIAGRVDMRMVPAPLDRRLLHRDLDRLRAGAPGGGRWFDDVPVVRIRLDGAEVPAGRLHSCNLETRDDGSGNPSWRRPEQAGHVLFDPELGRLALHASDEGKSVEVSCAFGAPFAIGGGPYDRSASFRAWRERIFGHGDTGPWVIGVSARAEEQTDDVLQGGPVVGSLAEAIERWNDAAAAGMRGLILMLDNASYDQDLTDAAHILRIPRDAMLAITAAAWPAVREANNVMRRDLAALAPAHRRPHIRSDLRIRAAAPEAGGEGGALILDGLLIEGEIAVMAGGLGSLSLRHATVGASAGGLAKGLRVISQNAGLAVEVDHCITGPLALGPAGGGLNIADSIIGEDRDLQADPDQFALVVDAPSADADIARSTIFGRASVRSIEAENSLFLGTARAAQRQRGCVRFSHVPTASRVPRRYRCQPELALAEAEQTAGGPLSDAERARIAGSVVPIFTASAWPASAFGQLALACSDAIAAGAFGGAEMGAGFAAGTPFRRANLADMLDEYLPFGLQAAPLFQT